MSKLFFLLILKLIAAMHNPSDERNNATNPKTDTSDASRTSDTQASSSTAPPSHHNLELMTAIDLNMLRQAGIISSSSDDLSEDVLSLEIELPVKIYCQGEPDIIARAFRVKTSDNQSEDKCLIQTTLRDLSICKSDLEPTVRKLTKKDLNSDHERNISCGPTEKKGSMFSFGYRACEVNAHLEKMVEPLPLQIEENSDFFEVYRFCHSKKDNAVIYTEHTMHNPDFLTGIPLSLQRQEDEKYEMMTDGFEYFGSQYETVGEAYKELTENPSAGDYGLFIQAQQLVPVDDMDFTLRRQPTYHYLNVAQMKTRQIRLWNYISHLIREDARKNGRKFSINTGAFNINSENKEKSKEIIIEEVDVWIKLVRYEKKASKTEEKNEIVSLAIVMNTGLDETKFNQFNDEMCKVNLCEKAFVSFVTFSTTRESVRCCETPQLAERFFDKELGTESFFTIESFIETKKMSLGEELKYIHETLNFFPKLM